MKRLIDRFKEILEEDYDALYDYKYPDEPATICAEECKKVSIEFIEWVLSKTKFRYFDEDATTWTNGVKLISTDELFEKFLNK